MAKKIEIKKRVFNRNEYVSAIDNKFKFFKEPEPVVDPDTVEELFRLYDKLYALIPIEGPEKTHQYLVEQSSELYKIDNLLENIQPLLDEVASLRGQLLETNRQILELEAKLASGGDINYEDAEQMQLLRTQLETANATIATLEQANSVANMATKKASEAAAEASKKAEEAAKAQATAAATASANVSYAEAAKEISELMSKKKKGSLYYAKRFLEDPRRTWSRLTRTRGRVTYNSWISTFDRARAQQLWWLFADDEEAREYYSNRKRRGYRNRPSSYNYLIPKSKNQAGDMTLDFVVEELKQAGYKAEEIQAGFESVKNFKNNVRTRIIKYKDPDKENELGYTFID